MNNGKNFEKLVRLIQETLKDIPSTEIFSNYKIENKSGSKREIDVLIKSFINNFEIIIAIECKDYKTPISVEKIEAFNSKCQRINGISKKIFVSSNGYQSDAIKAANDFEIELYNFGEISKDKISNWFPITQLKANIKIQRPLKIQVIGNENDIKHFLPGDDLLIHYFEERKPIRLENLLWEIISGKRNEIWNQMLFDFIKNEDKKEIVETNIPFSIDFEGIYVEGKNGQELEISKVKSEIIGWFDKIPANIIEARNYAKRGSNSELNTLSLAIREKERADIVISDKNEVTIFHTKEDGNVYRMENFLTYDPKTDEFTYEK